MIIYYYGIFNLMYDAYERMTIGLELDYGEKKLDANGYLNDDFIDDSKSRDAMLVLDLCSISNLI